MSLPARGAWIEIAYCARDSDLDRSLPARGAWIEMPEQLEQLKPYIGRSPQGERGLKSVRRPLHPPEHWSLPARGAWIEISTLSGWRPCQSSLPARGAWIEICAAVGRSHRAGSRSPQGERGLKYRKLAARVDRHRRSPQGERGLKCRAAGCGSLCHRRSPQGERGLKSRRHLRPDCRAHVAPRKGSVD